MSKAEADPGFPDRLQRAMLRRDLTSSDLARLMWGTGVDEKGYTVARNRQIIARYLEGNVYPRSKNRRRLSRALDIPYADLFPHEAAMTGSGIAMKPVGGQTILLELSVALPVAVAWTIVEMALMHERAVDPDPGNP